MGGVVVELTGVGDPAGVERFFVSLRQVLAGWSSWASLVIPNVSRVVPTGVVVRAPLPGPLSRV